MGNFLLLSILLELPFRQISAKSVNTLSNLTQIFGKKGRQLHPTLRRQNLKTESAEFQRFFCAYTRRMPISHPGPEAKRM
jgi:hypothetical protein